MIKIIIKFIFILGFLLGLWFLYFVFTGNSQSESNFVVENGQGVNQISASLYSEGLIKNKFVFETWLWLKKSENKVVAGVYSLPANISIRQLSNLLLLGPGNSQKSITLIEGWTRQMMADYLDKKSLSGAEFMTLSSSKADWQAEYTFLSDAPSSASLEGYIFPDTYYIDSNKGIENLIVKSLNNFDQKLTSDIRQEIDNQGKTIFEVLTLASIIEREVPKLEDKKKVAGIFLKRLDASIGLQSDATINYITGKGLAQPSYNDLEIDSPYNTYKYRGLPPGPISNPGIDSIVAVVYPDTNPYYYFLTTEEGEVIYSKTYEEHLANKAKYLD